MKALALSLLLLFSGTSYSQTFDAFYAALANDCDLDTLTEYLQQFEDLGLKELNQPGLNNTKDWIVQKYQDWGYTNIVEDDFAVSGVVTTNVVVTKTGVLYPDTYVIIDGHYDSKDGPGVNDNGTGTVVLLELARLLKDVPTEYSIKFIHFSAEEIGFEGSEHYVANVANPNNLDVKVLFNIDQVGGTGGEINNTITCERDQTPPNGNNAQSDIYTNELATCTQLYSSLQTDISFAYGSDYVPFMLEGYVVTGFYETNDSPYTHSIDDSLVHIDLPYFHEVTKASMGALCHFAVAIPELGLSEIDVHKLTIAPNPTSETIRLHFKEIGASSAQVTIIDLTGAIVQQEKITLNNPVHEINIGALASGSYLVQVESELGTSTEKFTKE